MKTNRRNFLKAIPLAGLSFGAVFSESINPASVIADSLNVNESENPTLRFQQNGQFKIMQFTDLHLEFTDEAGMKGAQRTLDLIKSLLVEEKPDLTIWTGDIIWIQPTGLKGGVSEAWEKATALFAELQLPFAITFGNHDHERSESAKDMLKMIQRNPYNLTYNADEKLPGAGNCVLPIWGSQEKKAKWNIYLFDSLAYAPKSIGGYDWIKNDQIQWYRNESQRRTSENGGTPLPALAFFHIPLPEYHIVRQQEDCHGYRDEEVCSPEINSGLFTSFIEMGDVMGVFVGHDHNNDYCGNHKGIMLAYGRKSGFQCYGDLEKGGRIITLYEDERRFNTNVRIPGQKLFEKDFQG
ncbi:MAG: metallophosphoesterase family protein [Planctomycetia bacterium]|nr:metallophosphoesterase family protein [Planctomycetia bacterium]